MYGNYGSNRSIIRSVHRTCGPRYTMIRRKYGRIYSGLPHYVRRSLYARKMGQ